MGQVKTTSSIAGQGFRPGGRRGMGAPVEKPKDVRKALGRLLDYFRPELLLIVLLAMVVIVTVIAGVITPALQSRAVDGMVRREFSGIPGILGIMIFFYILHGGATLLQGFLSASLSRRVVRRLRAELFSRVINLPVSWLDNHSHGDIMSRMSNDAENVSGVISQSLTSLFSGILMLAGTLCMMLYYSVPLTLVTCCTVIFTVLATKILTTWMRRFYVKRQRLLGHLNGIVEEKVMDSRTVTAYNLQEMTIEEFSRASDDLTRTGIIADIIGSAMGPMMNMLNNFTFVLVAAVGAWLALRGSITVGVISAFVIYSKQFSRPVNELAQLYGQIESAMAGAERIFEIMDVPSEDKSGSRDFEVQAGTIEFRHVHFSYVPGKEIIHDFNLRVEAGRKIALVGSTGSGKTTIVNLLMRFYPMDSGDITVDGVSVRDISPSALRDAVGIVLQDSVLFTDTLRHNLKYADPSLSDERMIDAARLSGCDKVAEVLPEGYDTVLASAGANLSQGQKQLITIGRAFLSYPRILILDEATSSVDTRTEKQIQNAMTELMKDRTSLIIAHRLSTIRDADTIVVMDHGRITETGNHEELLAKKGNYYNLYMTQFAGNAI